MVDLGCRSTFLSYASTRSSREREALAFVLQLLRFSHVTCFVVLGGALKKSCDDTHHTERVNAMWIERIRAAGGGDILHPT